MVAGGRKPWCDMQLNHADIKPGPIQIVETDEHLELFTLYLQKFDSLSKDEREIYTSYLGGLANPMVWIDLAKTKDL